MRLDGIGIIFKVLVSLVPYEWPGYIQG